MFLFVFLHTPADLLFSTLLPRPGGGGGQWTQANKQEHIPNTSSAGLRALMTPRTIVKLTRACSVVTCFDPSLCKRGLHSKFTRCTSSELLLRSIKHKTEALSPLHLSNIIPMHDTHFLFERKFYNRQHAHPCILKAHCAEIYSFYNAFVQFSCGSRLH